MNSTAKTIGFWLLIALCAGVLYTVLKGANNGQKEAELNFSQFMNDVDQGLVKEVTITGMEVRGKLTERLQPSTPPSQANDAVMSKACRTRTSALHFRDMNNGSWSWLINLGPLWRCSRHCGSS